MKTIEQVLIAKYIMNEAKLRINQNKLCEEVAKIKESMLNDDSDSDSSSDSD